MTNPITPKVGQILYFKSKFKEENRYCLVIEQIYLGYYRLECVKTGNKSRYNIGLNYLCGETDYRDWEIVSDPDTNSIIS